MEKIKISVIIPVYNVENYLEQCLDSIINQTLKEIEIIAVNDGSPDNSLEILKKYAEKDRRIIIVNKENGGLSSARNAGLKIAKGEYISFIDSDDFVELTMLEDLYNCTKEEKYDVIASDVFEYNNITKEIKKRKEKKETAEKGSHLINLCSIEVWNKIYRTDFLTKNNLLFREGIIHEDNLFSVKTLFLAPKTKYLNKYHYYYRKERKNSIMDLSKNSLIDKRIKSVNIIIDELLEFEKNYSGTKFEKIYLKLLIIEFYLSGNFFKNENKRENIREKETLNIVKKEWKTFSEKEKILLKEMIINILKIKSFNEFDLFDSFYWKNGMINKKIFRRNLEKKIRNFWKKA